VKSRIGIFFIFFPYILILSIVAFGQPSSDKGVVSNGPAGADTAADLQLRIYKETLQQGSSEDIRVDAAVGLLLQNTAQSRDVLISALKSDETPQARRAVCKALVKSRGLSQTIDSLDFFRDPLLQILQTKSQDEAELASEALLLFGYSKISDSLMEIINNKELSPEVRINGIYALQLRPEPSALRGLIGLLDDPNAEVAKAAETALQESFGIPVGTSRAVWSDILVELQKKSPEEIRRERLLRQEVKLRQVQAERDRWQKSYLALLDRHFEMLDEASQSKMILEMMASESPSVRLWSLDKASKYPLVIEDFQAKLFSMLSDSSRDVRLQTAKVLRTKSDLNPAEALLARFQVETDPEVALAIFEALGEACYYAFSPGAVFELLPEIKNQTLKIAAEYLESDSGEPAIKGAEVLRKILELNNLGKDSMKSYLKSLGDRYEKSISEDGALRAGLLSILAHLCGQGGAKTEACVLYEPYFKEGLTVQDNPNLRLAAAQGFSYVDKVKALELFKKNGLINDESPAVRQVVIDLAGQTGDASDLEWLLGALRVNGNSEQVWKAIKSICQRQKAVFLLKWLPALESADGVTDEFVREILEIAEQKAASEKEGVLQVEIQQQILSRQVSQRSWDSALSYLNKIGYDPSNGTLPSTLNVLALKVYLYSNVADGVVSVLRAELEKADLSDASPVSSALKDYFSSEAVGVESKSLFLRKIKSVSVEGRPRWTSLFDYLNKQVNGPASNELPAVGKDVDSQKPLPEESGI
jgi:HEAT repeat protein